MSGLVFALGSLIVLITAANVIFTLVLPRRPAGIERLSIVVNRSVRFVFLVVSRAAKSFEVKDALLAPAAPVALLAQLAVWLGFFVVGYACMLEPTTHGFSGAFTQAAVSLFSVGTGHAGGPPNQTVDIAAGATWAIVVTLQIAYLPSLYDAFNRREALVAMLESRAGLPAWGPEVLARHQLVGIIDALPGLYSDWERLAADLAESHTTYPVLLLFRSPEPWYSWVVGLLAVLDAAAMDLALSPDASSSQARLCLRMGFTTFNRIAKTLGWPVDLDPNPEGPIVLTFEEFAAGRAHAGGDRIPDGADRRGGVAELPRLAGELRDQRLPAGRPCGGSSGPVVGTAQPPALGSRGSSATAATKPRRQGVRVPSTRGVSLAAAEARQPHVPEEDVVARRRRVQSRPGRCRRRARR